MGVGSKSDIRSIMSPVTLAPAKKNPWRNPMLRNVVSPAYDAAETVPYKYGTHIGGNTAATNKLYWSDFDDNIGNEVGAHMIVLNAWNVTPGVKQITEFRLHGNYFGEGHNSAFYIELWKLDGTDLVRVAQSSNYVATIGASVVKVDLDLSASPFEVTLESGVEYFIGAHLVRLDTVLSTPQPNRSVDTDFTLSSYVIGLSANWADLTTVPVAGDAGGPYANVTEANYKVCIEIKYLSTNYLEQDITADTVGKYEIARATDRTQWIKLEGVAVADTNALTVLHQQIATTNWDTSSFATMELDCGDTTPGQNDLIYEGNTINLPDIDPGTGSEGQEGKTFDLWWVHTQALKNDLFWQCRHLEEAIHSHAVANASTRGTQYSHTEQVQFITLSGTATVSKIRVGVNPVILVGDSQMINGYQNALRSPNPNGWGAITTDLTKERMWIMHGRAGQTLLTMIAGIFAASTPGDGDGVELCGYGAKWFFGGIGVNDLSAQASASDDDIEKSVSLLIAEMATMLASILADGDTAMIAGIPPYDDAPTTDQYEAKACRWWNRGLLGICLAARLPYYNPYVDVVVAGTEADAIPEFNSTYSTDGTHYNSAGGAYVRPKMVTALERSTIDLRGAWD